MSLDASGDAEIIGADTPGADVFRVKIDGATYYVNGNGDWPETSAAEVVAGALLGGANRIEILREGDGQ